MIYKRLFLLTLVGGLAPWTGLPARTPTGPNPWLLCEPDPLAQFAPKATGASSQGPTEISGESGEYSLEQGVIRGNVVITKGDQKLYGPEVTLDRINKVFTAKEGVVYGTPDLVVRGKQGGWRSNDNTGWFADAEYYLPGRNAQGAASRIDFQSDDRTTQLEQVVYSTCERGHEFWRLRMPELELNQNTGRGVARHITLSLGPAPVFYWPYLSFPIDDRRQTGFLMPGFGYSSTNGLDLRFPFYWNIAPNQDMTITPRVLTKRGMMLGTEYRFLLPKVRGQVDGEYLPQDREYGDDRWGLFASANANLLPRFFNNLLYQSVSDRDYLKDFGNHLGLFSQTYLDRRLDNTYFGDNWSLLGRVQGFQTLDRDYFSGKNDIYDRLPQLLFAGAWEHPESGLNYGLSNEVVNFVRGQSLNGWRWDLWPGISLPLERQFGFIRPRVSYRATAYELRNQDAPKNIDPTLTRDNPTRHMPIASLDSGLFFDRPVEWPWGDMTAATLTLEPRLFYLYVPYRKQNQLPNFDTTSLLERNFSWLFLDNRFAGADRQGDANQVTAAVSSRLLNDLTGAEQFSFSVGRIYYFRDREVTLYPTTPEQTDRTSPVIAESTVQLIPNTYLRGYLHWDANEVLRDGVDVSYLFSPGRQFYFGYRYAQNEPEYEQGYLKQFDIAGVWSFNERWRAVSRWNYSLADSNTNKLLAGVEYDQCCWALRMVFNQYRDQPEDPLKPAVFVELELKGLTSLGTGSVSQFLVKEIPGYIPRTAPRATMR